MTERSETVSKLDAARRQLEEAIFMVFERRDEIAIHTLAGAARQVLLDLGKKVGQESLITDSKFIRPGMMDEVRRLINRPQNFFKHADRDAEQDFEFFPEATPFYILDAVCLYEALAKTKTPPMVVFFVWHCLSFPNHLEEGPLKDQIENHRELGIDPENRAVFLALARGVLPS
ncbi:MAG TPA: hypothetical protein ENK43_02995 [Planctomycetes bacterium]|nr:hypothetical protein [Planctomycetota bacterium]